MTGLLTVVLATVAPSGFFAPHMMLQRDRPIPVVATGGQTEGEGAYPYSFRLNDGAVADGSLFRHAIPNVIITM